MPAVVGSAEFQLGVNLANFNAGFAAAQREATTGSARIQGAIDGNFRKIEASAQRTGASLMDFVRIGSALTLIPAGLAAISAGMTKISEETQKAAQAQFALNKVYGESAEQYRAFSQAQAQATGRNATDFKQASVTAATLAKNYGLTSQQIQILIQRSADLAAVHGKDIPDAAQRVTAAIRGEAEAAEALGLTLNSDAVKAFADMTDEQRKNFETLDQVTKAQIIYRELLRQTNDVQGAAVERANSQLGAFDKLEAATNSLAATVGQRMTPAFADLASAIADVVKNMDDLLKKNAELNRAPFDPTSPDVDRRIQDRIRRAIPGDRGEAAAAAAAGPLVGPSPDEVRAAQSAAAADRKRRFQQELKDRKDDVERRAQIEIDGLEKEKQAVERSYAARRAALENQKQAELKAAEQKRDGAIKAIEAEAKAAEDGYRRQIIAAEKARDALLRAAEDKRDGALKAIKAEADAAKAASEAQIEQFEIARDRARQAAEDRRDASIDALDAEKRERENARIQEDRAQDDANRDTLRAIDARHDAVVKGLQDEIKAAERASDRKVRAIDREIAKAQAAAQKRIDGIEREIDKENDRHQSVLRNLEGEEDARLKVLDVQLKALDAQEQAADVAERMTKLQQKLADAQKAATRARGTGTPEQVNEARDELTRALRIPGNDIAIAAARERLQQLAGEGAQAIEKANRDLAEAQAEIQKEQTDTARDAERDRLEAAKDAISEEIAARKKAEDDRNRQRERELAADRDAAQKRLASRLAGLAKEKKAADDASKETIERIRDRLAEEQESHDAIVQQQRDIALQSKRAIEDRRRAEDQADQDKRKAIAETYEEEQRQIKATYDDPETGVIPALRRATEAAEREYAVKREAVNAAYKEEQDQIKATYDDPEFGIIAKLREQARVAAEEYAARKDAVNAAYKEEQDRIRETYDDPENGLFAKLEKAKQATIDSLNTQIEQWRQWKTDVVKEIGEALEKLDEFIKKVKELDGIEIGNNTPDERGQVPGGVGPPIPRGFGGDMAYGPVVRNASPDSYWTSGGTHGGHPAADIFAPKGSPIYAPVGGQISGYSVSAGGNAATLIGDDGRAYYFAHGNVPFISGRVERGQEIGQVGNTGNAQYTVPHLHFAIARSASSFAELNGSGDINGDSSYWGSGGTSRAGGDQEIEIQILGRRFRVRMARANVPGNVGRAISEGLRLAGLPADWLLPLAQIAAAETGTRYPDGSVEVGSGSSRAVSPTDVNGEHASGLMQTLPSTFRRNAIRGYEDIFNPIHNAAAAARYIERRYGSPWNTPYYRSGAFSTIGVEGYRNGTMIREPTLLAGLVSGRLGIAGETGQPERLMGVDETRAERMGRGGDVTNISVSGIGLAEVAAEIKRQMHREQLLRGVRR